MIGAQCENCRTFFPQPAGQPPGWLIIYQVKLQPPEQGSTYPFGGASPVDASGSFCSWDCVRDYAIAKTLLPG